MKIIEKFFQESSPSKLGINGKNRICIDFDGVIHNYSEGYKDGTIYDKPMKGVEKALKTLSEKFELVCFSARINAGDEHGKKEMVKWLKKYNLFEYFKQITDTKIPALVYIDDNAIRHTDWDSTFDMLKNINIL